VYILVIDDSQFTTALVQFALKKEGYEVEVTDNPRGAMQMIEKRVPDLLILDIAMPYQSGFEFTARLRDEGYDIPLIFITAQDSMESKLRGFHVGADDYICKPFDHQELVARVHAVLRRIKKSKHVDSQRIRVGGIELLPAEQQVLIDNQSCVMLTRTEMQVLRVLMSHPDQAVSRDQLLASVWNDNENNSNIVDVYVGRLRKKLEQHTSRPRMIVSVRRVGYKFVGK
jgi:DNA-binding response OmpR family regulator